MVFSCSSFSKCSGLCNGKITSINFIRIQDIVLSLLIGKTPIYNFDNLFEGEKVEVNVDLSFISILTGIKHLDKNRLVVFLLFLVPALFLVYYLLIWLSIPQVAYLFETAEQGYINGEKPWVLYLSILAPYLLIIFVAYMYFNVSKGAAKANLRRKKEISIAAELKAYSGLPIYYNIEEDGYSELSQQLKNACFDGGYIPELRNVITSSSKMVHKFSIGTMTQEKYAKKKGHRSAARTFLCITFDTDKWSVEDLTTTEEVVHWFKQNLDIDISLLGCYHLNLHTMVHYLVLTWQKEIPDNYKKATLLNYFMALLQN